MKEILLITIISLCCCVSTSAQFSFSFVFGNVNTPQSPSYEVPPTQVLMPATFSNGVTTTFSATTSYSSFGNNPYTIILPSGGNISSAKIYVDLSTTLDDYVDLSCIRVSDIVTISAYILGNISFTSSQKVAADVNISGSISVTDMIEIRRTILGLQDNFNNSININGATYQNVSAVYPTQNDLNQLLNAQLSIQYSCVYDYNPFPSNSLLGQNFVAVRLGDVNESCDSFFASNFTTGSNDFWDSLAGLEKRPVN